MFIGGVIASISCVVSAYVDNIDMLILTYGVFGGIRKMLVLSFFIFALLSCFILHNIFLFPSKLSTAY